MSAFWTVCPACGEHYFHMFVGTELLAGHSCPAPPVAQGWLQPRVVLSWPDGEAHNESGCPVGCTCELCA